MPSYFKNIYSSFRFKNPAATNTSDAPSQTTISPISPVSIEKSSVTKRNVINGNKRL